MSTVRTIIREYEQHGEASLLPQSRRPHRSPRKTPEHIEEKVLEWKSAHSSWGVQRIAKQIAHDEGIQISPVTVWRILKRTGVKISRKRKKNSGGAAPAVWTWERYEDREGVILLQVDWKYILDKKALGTKRYDHIRKRKLPRFQFTVLEARSPDHPMTFPVRKRHGDPGKHSRTVAFV